MPSNNYFDNETADRYRTMRFVIADDHAPLSEESEATLATLREQAARRLETDVAAELASFPQMYMNSWGDWSDLDRQRRPEPAPVPANPTASFTVTRQPPRNKTPFTVQRAFEAMVQQGYDDYKVVLEIPGPYPDSSIVGVIECVRERNNGGVDRMYFAFARRSASTLMIQGIFSESEYVTNLRRRTGDTSHFYRAQAEGRRRAVAKVLSAGAEQYQLLLAPVVDDGELREQLTTKEYRRAMASPEQRVLNARARMHKIRRERADKCRAESEPQPVPSTERGRRAMNAVQRRQSNESTPRSRSLRGRSRLDMALEAQSDSLE